MANTDYTQVMVLYQVLLLVLTVMCARGATNRVIDPVSIWLAFVDALFLIPANYQRFVETEPIIIEGVLYGNSLSVGFTLYLLISFLVVIGIRIRG